MFVVLLCCPLTNRPLEPLGTIAPLKAFFLWEKKEIERVRTTTTKRKGKTEREKYTRTQTHINTHNCCSKPTQMDMMAGLFSLCLSTLLCSSAFLSLGLIRLLVEMEAIGEDSWANDESVCAVIALIKRVVFVGGKERKRKSLTMKGPGALLSTNGLISVKRTPFVERGFCKLR